MSGLLRKTGFLLSAIAIFFITAILPLHHHQEEASATTKTHCSVCQFSQTVRSTETTPHIVTIPYEGERTFIAFGNQSLPFASFRGLGTSRAPPTV